MKRYKLKLNEDLTANSLNGLSNTTWDSATPEGGTAPNPVSGQAATEDQLAAVEAKIVEMKSFGGAQDNIEIPAGTRKNVQFNATGLSEGWVIGAYKQISILNASDGGQNFSNVVIQSFSTTGGSTKANISLYNQGTDVAKVRLDIAGIAIKSA